MRCRQVHRQRRAFQLLQLYAWQAPAHPRVHRLHQLRERLVSASLFSEVLRSGLKARYQRLQLKKCNENPVFSVHSSSFMQCVIVVSPIRSKCSVGCGGGKGSLIAGYCLCFTCNVHSCSSDCAACEAGKYTANEGLSECTNCDPGQYQPKPNSSGCDNCREGFYQFAFGARCVCIRFYAYLFASCVCAGAVSTYMCPRCVPCAQHILRMQVVSVFACVYSVPVLYEV